MVSQDESSFPFVMSTSRLYVAWQETDDRKFSDGTFGRMRNLYFVIRRSLSMFVELVCFWCIDTAAVTN